jgi:hypothetical protein
LAQRHRHLIARLEPVGLNRYWITEKDIQTIERYLSIIQQDLKGESTWEDIIRYGGAYSTSILIHEIVEIRALEARGLNPLKQRTRALRALLGQHVEAHVIALYEEHLYLQEVIVRFYNQRFEVATLVKANRNDETDLQLFLESEVGIYLLEEDRVEEARHILAKLKGEEL